MSYYFLYNIVLENDSVRGGGGGLLAALGLLLCREFSQFNIVREPAIGLIKW